MKKTTENYEPGVLRTFHITIGVGIVTASLSALIIFVHWTRPALRDEASFAMIAITAAGGAYAAYYIGKTLRVQVQLEQAKMKRQRQRDTFEMMSRLDSEK